MKTMNMSHVIFLVNQPNRKAQRGFLKAVALGILVALFGTAPLRAQTIINDAGTSASPIGDITAFSGSSNAESDNIINFGPLPADASNGATAGETDFYDISDAGSATITNDGSGGITQFFDDATADGATIYNEG